MRRILFINVRIALYYAIAAHLGLLLAPQPGTSATLLWASSGVALGMLLLRGNVALPGIFLGSFVVICLNTSGTTAPLVTLLVSAAGSVAVALAAFTAGLYMKRHARSAPIWASANDVLVGTLIMGLACALSAILGIGVFYLAGLLDDAALTTTLTTWWLGQFLGMVIFTPLVYTLGHRVWKGEWHPSKATEIISPTVAYSVFAAIALVLFLLLWNREDDDIFNSLDREASLAANSLMAALRTTSRDLESIRALVVAHDDLSKKDFLVHTSVEFGDRQGYPRALGLGWAPRVSDPRDWELKMLSRGETGVSLFEVDDTGQRVPVQKRADYFPVQLIYPSDDINRAAIGFDLGSEPMRRAAIERARDTGDLSMMGPIFLVQSEARAPGMLMCWPIYRKGAPLDTVQMRRAALTGVASGAYPLGTVFDAAMSGFEDDIALHLLDNVLAKEGNWYHTRPSPLGPAVGPSTPAPALAALKQGFHGLAVMRFAGQEWSIVAKPGPTYVAAKRTWMPWALLSLTLALGIGISSIMIERISARKRLEDERRRTEDALREARAANEAKSYFMAAASHDIKQPLYALAILTDTLMMSNPPSAMKPVIKGLGKSIKEMSQHFDTLMDVGRFQDGSFEAKARGFPLSELSRRTAQEIGPLCREKGLQWVIAFDDADVYSDPELLLRLLRNLLINAVRFTEDGGVRCTAKQQGKQVIFKVSDTGPGLSPDQQQMLFSEVKQGRADVIHATGLGLGLSIVNKISLALDLGIELASSGEGGTTLTFRVPLAPGE